VYLFLAPEEVSLGTMPLSETYRLSKSVSWAYRTNLGCVIEYKKGKEKCKIESRTRRRNLQSFQCILDIRKLEENSLVGDLFIIKHKTNTPDRRRETYVLSTS
jgi:hypothetical protein